MSEKIFTWLANYYETDEKDLKGVIAQEYAAVFLIIWSIFESKCFEGFVTEGKLKEFVEKNTDKLSNLDIESDAKHFYLRYKDKGEKYKHLVHCNKKNSFVEDLLTKDYDSINKEDKVHFYYM